MLSSSLAFLFTCFQRFLRGHFQVTYHVGDTRWYASPHWYIWCYNGIMTLFFYSMAEIHFHRIKMRMAELHNNCTIASHQILKWEASKWQINRGSVPKSFCAFLSLINSIWQHFWICVLIFFFRSFLDFRANTHWCRKQHVILTPSDVCQRTLTAARQPGILYPTPVC